MADEVQDIFAFITDNCQCTSSQEELLSHAQFAREDETFPDDDEPPYPAVEGPGENIRNLDRVQSERRCGGEFVAGDVDNAGAENLGFRGERKRGREGESSGTKVEGNCGEEREIEPQLKEARVSPLVHFSGKVVIEGGDEGEKVIAFSGDLKGKVASSSRSIVPEGAGCTEKLESEGFEDDVRVDGEVWGESGVKKQLETEVINLEQEKIGCEVTIIGEKGNVNEEEGEGHGESNREAGGDVEQGDGTSAREEEEGGTSRGKRELPPSMFLLDWAEGSRDGNGNGSLEGGMKEMSGEGKRDGQLKSSEDDGFKCILDVLKMLASEEYSNDNKEIDIFQTAKRCGMTFPRSRFLPEVQED